MNIKTAVYYVASKFNYLADKKLYIGDGWFVMPERNQKMFGDCDDFAITSLWLACDENIFKFILNVLFFTIIDSITARLLMAKRTLLGMRKDCGSIISLVKPFQKNSFLQKPNTKSCFFIQVRI